MVDMSSRQDTAAAAAARAGVTITIATVDELAEVLAVQRSGFGRVAARFGIDPADMAPLRESLSDLIDLRADGIVTFIARSGTGTAGTVRARRREDGVVEIGRLAVADDHVRRGVATALMLTIESSFPEASRFELYTGAEATEPLALYARLGYGIFRREEHAHWRAVWLAKELPGGTAPDDARLH